MQNGSDSPFTSFLKTNECKNQSQISLSQFIKHLVRNKKKTDTSRERKRRKRKKKRETNGIRVEKRETTRATSGTNAGV